MEGTVKMTEREFEAGLDTWAKKMSEEREKTWARAERLAEPRRKREAARLAVEFAAIGAFCCLVSWPFLLGGLLSCLARRKNMRVWLVCSAFLVGVAAGGGAAFGIAVLINFHDMDAFQMWGYLGVPSAVLGAATGWLFSRTFMQQGVQFNELLATGRSDGLT